MIDTNNYTHTSVLNETTYEILSDSKHRFLIENNSDILIFKTLTIFLSTNENSLDFFKNNLRYTRFIYEINGQELYSISLKLLIELSSKKIENNIIIELPNNVLREIFLYRLNHLPIVCRIDDENNELINKVTNFSLLFRSLKMSEERKIIEFYINKPIPFQKITSEYHTFLETNAMTTIMCDIQSRILTKGFLINANIYYLNHIKLYINDEIYIDYDIYDINNLCHIISNNVIFFSLSQNIINENGIESRIDCMDLSNTQRVKLFLNFTKPQESITIFSVQKGLLKYKSNNIILELNPQNIMSSLLTV